MEMMKLMEERHSVRQYEDKRIEDEKRKVLVDEIEKINRETGFSLMNLSVLILLWHTMESLQVCRTI